MICFHRILLTKKDIIVCRFFKAYLTHLNFKWFCLHFIHQPLCDVIFCLYIQPLQKSMQRFLSLATQLAVNHSFPVWLIWGAEVTCSGKDLWPFYLLRLEGVISLQTVIRFCHCSANPKSLCFLAFFFFFFFWTCRRGAGLISRYMMGLRDSGVVGGTGATSISLT